MNDSILTKRNLCYTIICNTSNMFWLLHRFVTPPHTQCIPLLYTNHLQSSTHSLPLSMLSNSFTEAWQCSAAVITLLSTSLSPLNLVFNLSKSFCRFGWYSKSLLFSILLSSIPNSSYSTLRSCMCVREKCTIFPLYQWWHLHRNVCPKSRSWPDIFTCLYGEAYSFAW